MTPDEFQRRCLEARILRDELAHIEEAMHAVLRKLRCPTAPVEIYALLKGERTWPHRLASRDKPRASAAMFALLELATLRGRIGPIDGDPLRAAATALHAALCAAEAMPRRRSAHPTGSDHDGRIARYARLYDDDEDLRSEYRSKATFILARLNSLGSPPARRTVQRRLKALKLA